MKFIFLFLITFTAHAQFVAYIDYVEPSQADGKLSAKTQQDIDKEVGNFIKKREKRGVIVLITSALKPLRFRRFMN